MSKPFDSYPKSVRRHVDDMWSKKINPRHSYYLSKEAVEFVGFSKIALRRNVPYYVFDAHDRKSLIWLLKEIYHTPDAKAAIVLRQKNDIGEHYFPLYVHNNNGRINVCECDSYGLDSGAEMVKGILEFLGVEKYSVISCDVDLQADGYNCSVFSVNTLAHMVDEDRAGNLFAQTPTQENKYRGYIAAPDIPPSLLKLTQLNIGQTKRDYYADHRPVAKNGEDVGSYITQHTKKIRGRERNNAANEKGWKYRHHAAEMLAYNEESREKLLSYVRRGALYDPVALEHTITSEYIR